MRLAKLICTLGPASVNRIGELVGAGMDVARINFSYGDPHTWKTTVQSVRAAAKRAGREVGIMGDLPGPKVRLGHLLNGEAHLIEGRDFHLVRGPVQGDSTRASTIHPGLVDDLHPGDRIFMADGSVELRVRGTCNEVTTEVVRGGVIRTGTGLNVPAEQLSLPALSDRDAVAARVAMELGIDLLAQSFVRGPSDVFELRQLLGDASLPIVAKVETRPAVESCLEIAAAADAIMVARGDLGVEIPLESVPFAQKKLIGAARSESIPAIVATQMLESMTTSPNPTRAEVSDVANAVLDGADAVLLSAETAIGKYPLLAAQAAGRILEVAEREGRDYRASAEPPMDDTDAAAIAIAAASAARHNPNIVAVACYTQSGLTARLLSAARPEVAVVALSADPRVVRRLNLWHGVIPVHSDPPQSTDDMITLMDRHLIESGGMARGDSVLLVAATPVARAATNFLKIHTLGSWG